MPAALQRSMSNLFPVTLGLALSCALLPPLGFLLAEHRIRAESVLLVIFLTTAPWLARRSGDVFSPTVIFPAAYLAWFAIGSYTIMDAYDPNLPLLDPVPLRFWGIYALGFLGYWLAMPACRPRTHALRNFPFSPSELSSQWNRSRFGVVFGALLGIGVLAYAYLVTLEGVPLLDENVSEARVLLGQRHGIALTVFIAAFWALLPMAFVKLWSAPRPSARQRWLTYGFAALACSTLASLGSRGQAAIPLLVVFVLRHYMVRRWRARFLAAAGLLVYVAISVAGYARDLQMFGPVYQEKLLAYGIPGWLQPLTHGYLYVRAPVVTFRDITTVIPAAEPYQFGWIFVSPFAALLPGHHESSDLFFKRILGHEFVGFGEPASLLGSFYADFGVLGIVAGMFLTGLLAACLYRRMQERRSLLDILLFCYFTQVLLLSLFGNIFPYLITIWLPLMWWAADRWMRQPQC